MDRAVLLLFIRSSFPSTSPDSSVQCKHQLVSASKRVGSPFTKVAIASRIREVRENQYWILGERAFPLEGLVAILIDIHRYDVRFKIISAGKLEVGLWRCMDVDRAKQQDLGRRAGRKGRRDRLSAADSGDLIFTQSDVLPKECLKVRVRLRKAGQGGRGEPGQQSGNTHCTSDHGNITIANYTASLWGVLSSRC